MNQPHPFLRNLVFFLTILVLVISCTKTITPSLNLAPTQIVIQGAISDTAGPYYVSIVQSVGFYADNTYPGVPGALITVTDVTTGLRDQLLEISPGLYKTQALTQGVYGHTYSLNVSLGGKTYTSSSTMPQPVLLDSLTFDHTEDKTIRPQANYQDPAGIINYYKYNMTINGVLDKRFQTFDDRLSDGRYIHDKMDVDTFEVKQNDLVKLSLVGIEKKVWTYLSEAEAIAYSNDNLAAPASPETNITGGCLGYFSAQTVSSRAARAKF